MGEKAFRAHRFVLHLGAPLLAELCTKASSWSDGRVGDAVAVTSVTIADVEPRIFRHLLYYVDGGRSSGEDIKANAREIIDAAERYGVKNLKLEVSTCYVESTAFTVENVVDNLIYADSRNCALLREAAVDYIMEHGDAILGRASFFDDAPGSMVMDLLAAVTRVRSKYGDIRDAGNNFDAMRVGALRKMLHDRGLEVDGSREAMAARLKENCSWD